MFSFLLCFFFLSFLIFVSTNGDSYYEYLLKMYVLWGDVRYWDMFMQSYVALQVRGEMKGTFLAVKLSWYVPFSVLLLVMWLVVFLLLLRYWDMSSVAPQETSERKGTFAQYSPWVMTKHTWTLFRGVEIIFNLFCLGQGDVPGGGGRGCSQFVHGRSRMTMEPRAGRSGGASGYPRAWYRSVS